MPLLSWGDFWTLAADARRRGRGRADDARRGRRRRAVRAAVLPAGRPPARRAPAPGGCARLRAAGRRRTPSASSRRRDGRARWRWPGALPYRLHDALRRPFAAREAPRWLRPRAVRDLVRSDDPLAWKRLRRAALVGRRRARGRMRDRAGRRVRAPASAGGPRRSAGPPSAAGPRSGAARAAPAAAGHASIAASPGRCCARAWRGCFPTRSGCGPGRRRFESLIVDCLTRARRGGRAASADRPPRRARRLRRARRPPACPVRHRSRAARQSLPMDVAGLATDHCRVLAASPGPAPRSSARAPGVPEPGERRHPVPASLVRFSTLTAPARPLSYAL